MRPVAFSEATKTLGPPPGVSDEDCGILPVWTDGEITTSCWRMGFGERIRLLSTGRLWLSVWIGGGTQPPVSLSTRPPFVQDLR